MSSMTKKALSLGTIGIAITLALAIIAELYRFHGVLLIDLWVPLFTFTWLAHKILTKTPGKPPFRIPIITYPAGIFILIGFASLLINSANLSTTEFLESAFYCVRWISMFFLTIIVFNEPKRHKTQIVWLLFLTAFVLSAAGFIQLQLLPVLNETTYELDLGWDPHVNRLFATWFDPNFLGGYLAFILPLLIGTALDKPTWRKYLIPIGAVILVALILTFSRSSYLALLAGLTIFGLIKSRKLLLTSLLILLIAVSVTPQLQSRTASLVDSAKSVFTEDYTLPDQSSRLRFESWSIAFQLLEENPVLGHGYNRYKHAALEHKLIVDPEKHSSTGSDSSLLTILATTGRLGFMPFIAIYFLLIKQAWQHRRHGYAAGLLGALIGLFIHSIFVNSMLFPLFMAPFWLAAGLLPPIGNRTKS
jgi:O-antigen ligase